MASPSSSSYIEYIGNITLSPREGGGGEATLHSLSQRGRRRRGQWASSSSFSMTEECRVASPSSSSYIEYIRNITLSVLKREEEEKPAKGYGAKKPWEGGRGPNSTGFENIYEPPAQGGS